MISSSPIPRGVQPGFHEGSGMRSMRDGDATSRQWIRARTSGRNTKGTDLSLRYMTQRLNMLRRRIVGGGSSSSALDIGEYNPAKSYKAKAIVFFTPEGMAAGTYLALQTVAAGTSPDTGAPNWMAFPNSPPGVWA